LAAPVRCDSDSSGGESSDDQRCAAPPHVVNDLKLLAPMFEDPDTMASVSKMRTKALEFLHGDMYADLLLQGCKEPRLWTFRQRLNGNYSFVVGGACWEAP
jgi:hypothetical protein